jgi:hypothetical protein
VVALLGFSPRSKPGGVANKGRSDPNLSHQAGRIPNGMSTECGLLPHAVVGVIEQVAAELVLSGGRLAWWWRHEQRGLARRGYRGGEEVARGALGAGFVWDLDGLTEEAALMTRYFREV